MIKKNVLLVCFLLIGIIAKSQPSTTLFVGGDVDKFYPVVFQDDNWQHHRPTEIQIGRSPIHIDELWKGSLMAKFIIHNTHWGHRTRFTDVDLWQKYNKDNDGHQPFIAGYEDATSNNATYGFVIWLRGNSTYYYNSNTPQNPVVYDGVKNALPFQEENGPAHNFKTVVDESINPWGKTTEGTIYTKNNGLNYMNGSLGLGTLNTQGYKLAVNGKMRAHEIKVETANWPDYVFESDYKLTPLDTLEAYIKKNKHLPEIPKAAVLEKEGVNLGEMNKLLVKKIEELTLIVIEQNKRIEKLER